MAKKGQAAQLQTELNTDEDWDKFIQRDGLIVVDIYSEWCGPCSAMVANLKKLKLEVGGDNLQLGVAKSNTVSYLERFKHKSEPTWMFISGGKMVNLMFGANAPKLTRLIINELKLEAAAKEGTATRTFREISELADEEQVRYDIKKAIEDEALRLETEKKNQLILERRTAVANVVLENVALTGVIVVFPHAKDNVQATLAELWEPAELVIAATEKVTFTKEIIEELLYFSGYQFNDFDVENLISAQTLAYLVKPSSPDEFSGDIDDAVLNLIYGESKCPPGSPESPAQLLMGYIIIPKEVTESATALKSKEDDMAIPSIPSLSAFQMPTSSTKVMSKSEMESRSGSRSRSDRSSRLSEEGSPVTSEQIQAVEEEAEEEEEEEKAAITGLWAPPNPLTKATAIKMLFPKIYEPFALPEPVPIPPHIAIVFEAFKRREVLEAAADYPDEVMRFGFFDGDNPEEAKLIAKTVPKFEKALLTGTTHDERLVIQLSKKRSEAWCVLAQLGPTCMSQNTVEGERQCKLFFAEDYDVPEEEEEEVKEVKKKKGRRGKKSKEARAAAGEEEVHEEQPTGDEGSARSDEQEGAAEGEGEGEEDAEGEGEEGEGEGEGEEEGGGEEAGLPEEADKATSPMPEEGAQAEE